MKKWIAMMLAALLVMSLAACGNKDENADGPEITLGAQADAETEVTQDSAKPEATEAKEAVVADGVFSFTYKGTELVPGTPFQLSTLPSPASTYNVPSCALDGEDNVYNYEAFELTALDDGKSETIYSIFFLDPTVTTPEGLALGDEGSKVTEIYGDGYAQDGNAYVYYRTNTVLTVIVENGAVTSIEIRMANDAD